VALLAIGSARPWIDCGGFIAAGLSQGINETTLLMGAILAMAILDRGWTRVPAGLAALVGGFHLWMAAPSARQALTEAGCEPELGLLLTLAGGAALVLAGGAGVVGQGTGE
jgi:hypothetical protein